MSQLAFTGTIVLPDRLSPDTTVLCRDGQIVSVGRRPAPRGVPVVDVGKGYLSPGFIDIHVHGGQGADFMDGNLAAVQTACRSHALHGTTSLFPTTTTGSPAQIAAMLNACGEYQQWSQAEGSGPNLVGVHLYGPYFA